MCVNKDPREVNKRIVPFLLPKRARLTAEHMQFRCATMEEGKDPE